MRQVECKIDGAFPDNIWDIIVDGCVRKIIQRIYNIEALKIISWNFSVNGSRCVYLLHLMFIALL
jgi:hypothetical protein